MKQNDIKPEIRPVRIQDYYEVVFEMMRGLHESEKELFDKTDDWNVIGKNYMRHVIDMQEENDGAFLLAYIGSVPAGFIFGYIDEEDEDSRIDAYTGKDLYVSDGYIYPEFRRHGIYKMLNEQLEAIYIEKGVRRILRFTLTSNTRMQQFLEKEGYRPVRFLYEKWLTEDGKGVIPLGLKEPE